jgi:hypothetical protein
VTNLYLACISDVVASWKLLCLVESFPTMRQKSSALISLSISQRANPTNMLRCHTAKSAPDVWVSMEHT